MGVLEYEDFVDTSVEYAELNAIEQERASAAVGTCGCRARESW
jgi:hypothetical protein